MRGKESKGTGKSGGRGRGRGRLGGFLRRVGLAIMIFLQIIFGAGSPEDEARDLTFDFFDTNEFTEDSADVFATYGTVPPGFAVLDTACLRACAGGITLDEYVKHSGVATITRESTMKFKGINDQAPIAAEGEQEIPMGIGGVGCSMRFTFEEFTHPHSAFNLTIAINGCQD